MSEPTIFDIEGELEQRRSMRMPSADAVYEALRATDTPTLQRLLAKRYRDLLGDDHEDLDRAFARMTSE